MPGTLVYFDMSGRAAPIRMMLDHKKVKYEDKRIDQATFKAGKEKGDWGSLPVWIENGQTMNETKALVRYLGTVHGYYPKDAVMQWQADVWVDYAPTLLTKIGPFMFKPALEADGEKVM